MFFKGLNFELSRGNSNMFIVIHYSMQGPLQQIFSIYSLIQNCSDVFEHVFQNSHSVTFYVSQFGFGYHKYLTKFHHEFHFMAQYKKKLGEFVENLHDYTQYLFHQRNTQHDSLQNPDTICTPRAYLTPPFQYLVNSNVTSI